MKYLFSKQAVILWASLFIIILIFGATSNLNFISTVEKFDGDRHGVSKLSNISSLDVEYEENKLLLTAQLAVNFSFINAKEKDWLLEIDKTTSLIHKRLSIQHRRHSLPFVVKELMQPQSVCIISIQEYSSGGEMQYLMGNLTAHKRDFAQHHQRESNMGYINVNAQKYRNDHRHLLPANVSSTWLKLPILRDMISNDQKHLQQRLKNNRYDWYMWVDADVLFTNFSCTFQELLSANHHLIVPGDLNTGVFFIRNHPWSAQFLDLWFSKWSAFRSSLGQEDEALSSLLNNDIWDRHVIVYSVC